MANSGWPYFVRGPATKSAHTQAGAGSSSLLGVFAAYRAIKYSHRPVAVRTRERPNNALGFDVKEGEPLIFKPEDSKNQLVVRMQMEDWPKLAVTVQ
ncbi:MAG TPA: hypothetical protein VGH12_08945 [Steroidobacteraceae bacterium]